MNTVSLKINRKALLGYSNKLTVHPSDDIALKASAESADTYSAQLIKNIEPLTTMNDITITFQG